jgi:hypothetical protein
LVLYQGRTREVITIKERWYYSEQGVRNSALVLFIYDGMSNICTRHSCNKISISNSIVIKFLLLVRLFQVMRLNNIVTKFLLVIL